MKNFTLFCSVLGLLFGSSAFAAKFTNIESFTSPAIQSLAKMGADIVSNTENFGDASEIVSVSFTRKASEIDLNTVKQLNISGQIGDAGDNDGTDETASKVSDVVDYLFSASLNQENQDSPVSVKAVSDVTAALTAIQKDPTLKLFSAGHGDDDGSWSAVDVLDTKNNEIFVLKLGFKGN